MGWEDGFALRKVRHGVGPCPLPGRAVAVSVGIESGPLLFVDGRLLVCVACVIVFPPARNAPRRNHALSTYGKSTR